MSGSTIGGVVGGVIGFWVGGPTGAQIGFALGSAVGGYLDPQVLQGPTLGDIPVQTSQEGVPRPIIYGAPQPFPGNIIQTGPKVFSIKETKQGKGGPVIESEEVHQTYAIRICEGPATVLEILRDGKYVYSRTGTRPLDADSAGFASKIVLYEGDETQLPDSSLEGLPAANGGGAGNVPAYRGTAYMVVVHDNLTPTGGRIPNYEFRMSSNATVDDSCVEQGLIAWWPLDDAVEDGPAQELVANRDGIYTADVVAGAALSLDGTGSMKIEAGFFGNMDAENVDALEVSAYDGWTFSAWFRMDDDTVPSAGRRLIALGYSDEFTGRYAFGLHLGGTNALHLRGGFTNGGGDEQAVEDADEIGEGQVIFAAVVSDNVNQTLTLYKNGVSVGQIVPSGSSDLPVDFVRCGGLPTDASATLIGAVAAVKLYNYALSADEIRARYAAAQYELPDSPGSYVDKDGNVYTTCASRATTGVVYLSDIELDIISRVGLETSQYDVSDITAIEVQGFLIGKQVTAAGALAPLATAYFHDLPEYDLQIHARRRGDASAVTLTDDDFVESNEDEEVRAQAIELPRKLNLYFSDPSVNHAVVPVPAERVSTNVKATGIASVQLPLVLSRDEAKQKAEVMLKCIYEQSQGVLTRELPAFKYAQLVASDAITYDSKRWRIDKLEQLEGSIKIEAKRDRISNYSSQATAGSVLNPNDPISSMRGPSILYAMNLPRLRTQDNQPGVYLAVTGVLDGWPGAAIYLSTDGGVTEELVLTVTSRATLGELDVAIDTDDEPITVWVYDNRDLETVTAAELALRRNAFALITSADVAEVGQFMTATETAVNNHWNLTNVSRGLLGTTASAHAITERFVLLDGSIQFLPLSADYAGRTLIFRAVTLGTAPANNNTVSLVFSPQFTGPQVIDFYTNASGDIYTDADGAYYYKEE